MNPDAKIEIRDTEHFFYRLDLFQNALEEHAAQRNSVWKPNVKAMTKQWLDMGLRPRAVTRDLDWGIPLPLEGEEWDGKCIYVWFEAVQGYYSCAKLWSQRYANEVDYRKVVEDIPDGERPRHLYSLGKDNIPFHTVIWPALIMGLNHAAKGLNADVPPSLPGPGELSLEDNVMQWNILCWLAANFRNRASMQCGCHHSWNDLILTHSDITSPSICQRITILISTGGQILLRKSILN